MHKPLAFDNAKHPKLDQVLHESTISDFRQAAVASAWGGKYASTSHA